MLKQRERCRWQIASFVILIGGLSACGTTVKSTSTGVEMAVLGSEKLNGKEIVSFDLTGDKKANIWKVYRVDKRDGKEERILVRKDLDPNFDGKPDVSLYYNSKSQLEKESMDLDFDGSIDAVSFYEGDELVRRQMDLNFDGRMDVVIIYKKGALRVKKRLKNGRPYQWEYFVGERDSERLERICIDKDGDGKHVDTDCKKAPPPSDGDKEEKEKPPPAEKGDKGKASA